MFCLTMYSSKIVIVYIWNFLWVHELYYYVTYRLYVAHPYIVTSYKSWVHKTDKYIIRVTDIIKYMITSAE